MSQIDTRTAVVKVIYVVNKERAMIYLLVTYIHSFIYYKKIAKTINNIISIWNWSYILFDPEVFTFSSFITLRLLAKIWKKVSIFFEMNQIGQHFYNKKIRWASTKPYLESTIMYFVGLKYIFYKCYNEARFFKDVTWLPLIFIEHIRRSCLVMIRDDILKYWDLRMILQWT